MVTVELLSAMLTRLLTSLIGPRLTSAVDSIPEFAFAEPIPADRTRALLEQFTAGVRGSRAPPVASV